MLLYLKAIAFGITVAAPIGPMNILCMRRTLVQGWKYGFITAFGIASSDATYALVASLGLNTISTFIESHKPMFHLLAGIFLILFGLKIFLNKIPEKTTQDNAFFSLPYTFVSAIAMTLTNPLTLLFFATIFTGIASESGFNYVSRFYTVSGVFTGSFCWMTGVASITFFLRHIISQEKRRLIDKVTGTFLVLFGLSEAWLFLYS